MLSRTTAFALSPAAAFTRANSLLSRSTARPAFSTPSRSARVQPTPATPAPKMGLDIVTVKEGDGVNFPKKGQMVSAHYTGTLTSGSKFDSSRDRGAPFQFAIGVGQVIRAWDEGIMQMSKGQRVTMTATDDYAYGPRGMPPVIPPSATLIFDVELIDFK